MSLDPNIDVEYFYAEIEYDVVVPVYAGGEYEPDDEDDEEGE